MKYRIALMLLAVASLVSAASAKVIYNEDVTVPATTVANPCTGAPLVISGSIHTLISRTVDSNGGVHFMVHSNSAGLTATDQATGQVYHFHTQDPSSQIDQPAGNTQVVFSRTELPAGGEGEDDNANFSLVHIEDVVFNPDWTVNRVKFDRILSLTCSN